MSTSRIIIMAGLSVGLLSACFDAQPPPACNVVTGQAVFQISNYFAVLDKRQQSGQCADAPSADLKQLEVGMTRVDVPNSTQHRVLLRSSYLVQVARGSVYRGNQDPTNDCTKTTSPGKCAWCIAAGQGTGATLRDGGSAIAWLPDGGADLSDAGQPQGAALPLPDGGTTRIALSNACQATEEAISRVDEGDPQGKALNASALIPEVPDLNNVCVLSDFSGGVQHLKAEPLVGGSALPAIDLRTDWSNFDVINSTKAPGTYWTAELKLTEGACVTNYGVTAFYPLVTCAVLTGDGAVSVDSNGTPLTDEGACDPVANPEAGRATGSGISPNFKPTCRADILDWAGRPVCVPTAKASDLR